MLVEVKVPSPGESVAEATISAWLKKDGDYVRKNDELFEIESDKATLSVSAEVDGVVSIKAPVDSVIRIGAVACTIDTDAAPSKSEGVPPSTKQNSDSVKVTPVEASSDLAASKAIPSPAAAKMMAERGVTPDELQGTGRDGRITKADVLAYEKPVPTASPVTAPVAVETVPVVAGGTRNTRNHKLSALRVKVAERLVAAKNQTAMLTTFNEVDMTNIMAARTKYKDKFKEAHSVGLGFMSFFTKAVCESIQAFPAVNAMIDNNEVVFHDYVDMGIAVSAPKGLVVPVIRNAESMSFDQIESSIESLAFKARNNQLTLDEMTGGTFTISNGGVFGSLMSTPILNPPQSGILGMHNIVRRPVAVGEEIQIRPMMYLAFSYDHRIIDGRESVSFLVRVKELLEDPMRLLLKV